MDRPSIAFAKFLDGMIVVSDVDHDDESLLMVCDLCSETVCAVEPADTLRVLLNTALAHECPKSAKH